jgi:hypothetical protein
MFLERSEFLIQGAAAATSLSAKMTAAFEAIGAGCPVPKSNRTVTEFDFGEARAYLRPG